MIMCLDLLLSIVKALLSFSECDTKIRGGEEFRIHVPVCGKVLPKYFLQELLITGNQSISCL